MPDERVKNSGARRLVAYTRFAIAIPVLGLFAGALTLTIMAAMETGRTVWLALSGELYKTDAVLDFIELADVFLLATVLYIMSLGLYELFIDDTIELPDWLSIHDLDDLKGKLIGVIAVVLGVTFLGAVIKGTDAQDLAYLGVGIAAVIAAMGYFTRGRKG